MIALTLIAYTVGLWLGEALRDVVYGNITPSQLEQSLSGRLAINIKSHPKWLMYSGLFVLLKQKLRISRNEFLLISQHVSDAFADLIYGNVRSFVRT
jgi:hypothetical protein